MDEFVTISCSEYEQLKREIAELRAVVQQLKEEIISLKESKSLLKGGKSSRTGSTAPPNDIDRGNCISLRVSRTLGTVTK